MTGLLEKRKSQQFALSQQEMRDHMRVLILGASGMMGHKLWQVCRERFDSWVTVRSTSAPYARYRLFQPDRLLCGVDARDFDTVAIALDRVRPEVVVNAIGIVKQHPEARDSVASLTVNALFPHLLARACEAAGARLIHISTDCVFSGRKGMYTEADFPDADDLYGRSKLLGEVKGPRCLVLRTSMLGRELATSWGLVEWFLSQRGGLVQGYTHAIFSGLSTLVLAQLISNSIEHHASLAGLYHVSAEPTSKYDVLCLLRDAFRIRIDIEPFSGMQIDRSLDSSRFRAATGFAPPSWFHMIHEIAADPTPYDEWRRAYAS